MHYTNRLFAAAGAFVALFLLAQTASALTLPGFPPLGPSINAPKMVKLCDRVMHVAGITLTVPRICKDTPPPPPAVPQLTLTAAPGTIVAGDSATLTWDSTDATSCTASGGWTGAKSLDGNEVVTPGATTNYVLTCVNGTNSVVKDVTVTVTPPPAAPTLTLVKTVTNNNGGTAVAADFQAKIDSVNADWGVAHTVTAGAHTVSEVGMPGYTAGAWGGDCAADGSVSLVPGDTKTCTITNDDQAGTLIVKKVLVQDNGRTEVASDFSFQVGAGASTAFESDGQNDVTVDAGTYSVTEVAHANYSTTYENCTNVVITNGGTATCTITNDDIAPAPTTGTLVVDKVTQPSGDLTEFSITALGSGAITGGGAGTVTDATNKSYEVAPGTYAVTEEPMVGWVIQNNTCVDVVVNAGETKNCVITNVLLPKITVTKVVVNDDLGEKEVADFALFVDASPVISGEEMTTAIGSHTVSETPDSGYTGVISGDCAADGTITLAAGDVKSCTITNNDNVPVPPVGALLITEVLYDINTTTQGEETTDEWVEIKNGTNGAMDLSGYALKDNSGTVGDVFPSGTIVPAGGFLLVVGTSSTPTLWAFPVGTVVVAVDGDIGGNGLANAGDRVVLHDASDVVVDAVGWGTDTVAFGSASGLTVSEGSSLARTPQTADTNAAADWQENVSPNPGQ